MLEKNSVILQSSACKLNNYYNRKVPLCTRSLDQTFLALFYRSKNNVIVYTKAQV